LDQALKDGYEEIATTPAAADFTEDSDAGDGEEEE
jgi:hypothetical protein